jgi:hypothetical protein
VFALLVLCGCGPRAEREAVRGDAEPAAATETVSREKSEAASGAVDTIVLAAATAPAAGDPEREGWETEAISEVASGQLKELGHLLELGVMPSDEQLSRVLDNRFQGPVLLPDTMVTVFEDSTTEVRRWPEPTRHARPEDLSSSRQLVFGALVEAFGDLPERKTKFKLFRVEMDGREVTTLQYFHLSGRSTERAREHNATWQIGWSTDHADQLPRIRWIRLAQAEQVTSRVLHSSWLVDCTQSLLGRSPSDASTLGLQTGIDQWLTRLEGSLGVYNFGHHGVTVGDVNGDRLDDLYVCQTGGIPNHLFLQQPDGTLRDISAHSQVDYLDNTRSALLIDLDNDGDQDLVLALSTGLLFLENDGSGQFNPRARISRVRQAFSLAAADYDRDGRLDIYVCVYYGRTDGVSELPLPLPYFDATNGGQNYLIRNVGEWKFEDVTSETGLDKENHRFSFAAAWEDHDNDGDPDLLVVNDYGPNQLYVNEQGRFRNVAESVGLKDGAFGMSATWGDYDRDGDLDIYVANMFSAAGNRVTYQPRFKPGENDQTISRFRHLARGNSLFRNRGDGSYEDVSVEMGVTMGRWSWGSLFVDLNNDRWEDLLVANGFITGSQTDDL